MSTMKGPIKWLAFLIQWTLNQAAAESPPHSRARGRLPDPRSLGQEEDSGGIKRESKWTRHGKVRDKTMKILLIKN